MAVSVYWIEGPWSGRLAIVARPRGGEWLADEISRWRQAGIDVVVSLLTSDELAELHLQQERHHVQQAGLHFLAFPIPDRSIPSSVRETRRLVEQLDRLLIEGKKIGIHCRQSVGRSALLAASLLVHAGIDADEAFHRIEIARGCTVPETAEQREWVERFAALAAAPAL
jgi:protein-tyrosine phosphatase